MPLNQNRQIAICGETIDVEMFTENFDKYFPMVSGRFRPQTIARRSTMSESDFAKLIFNRLYKKPEFAISRSEDYNPENRILDALGINVVTYSGSTANIIFKNSQNAYKIKLNDLNSLIESIKKEVKYNKKNLDPVFGVELEFIADYSCRPEFNRQMKNLLGQRYVDENRYFHNNGEKWILGRDCSIHSRARGFSGFELTSPILHYNEHDLNELKSVLNLIKTVFHGTVNRSCGTHVHMSFNSEIITEHFLKHIARSYVRNEASLFDKLVQPSRREDKCRWCRHTSVIHYSRSRYQKLNFTNVSLNEKNIHLEFRQLDGTLDYEKINSWIKLQRLFVSIAYNSYNKHHTELSDCIKDVVKMPLEEVITSNEFTCNEVESLLKESKLIS